MTMGEIQHSNIKIDDKDENLIEILLISSKNTVECLKLRKK